MPCGTVLGAQNDPVTEEAAQTTESVQESEVSESEISEAETSENETESQTGTEAGTEKEINTEINTETGTETEIGMETEIETEQIELESSDFPQIGSKVTKNTVDCETKETKSTDWELVWSDEFNEDSLDLTKWD